MGRFVDTVGTTAASAGKVAQGVLQQGQEVAGRVAEAPGKVVAAAKPRVSYSLRAIAWQVSERREGRRAGRAAWARVRAGESEPGREPAGRPEGFVRVC